MKTIIILSSFLFCLCSCIKKKALKYDPKLVGTWVSHEDNVYSWLVITADGNGHYSTYGNDEGEASGEVKYSLFEKKMWIGSRKFKITTWLTGKTNDVSEVKTKTESTLRDTTYAIDYMMGLKTSILYSGRSITFYRVKQ